MSSAPDPDPSGGLVEAILNVLARLSLPEVSLHGSDPQRIRKWRKTGLTTLEKKIADAERSVLLFAEKCDLSFQERFS